MNTVLLRYKLLILYSCCVKLWCAVSPFLWKIEPCSLRTLWGFRLWRIKWCDGHLCHVRNTHICVWSALDGEGSLVLLYCSFVLISCNDYELQCRVESIDDVCARNTSNVCMINSVVWTWPIVGSVNIVDWASASRLAWRGSTFSVPRRRHRRDRRLNRTGW